MPGLFLVHYIVVHVPQTEKIFYQTHPTIIDLLNEEGITTVAIGKVNDPFDYRGIKFNEKNKSNGEGCAKLLEYSSKVKNSFMYSNLVDFDV